MMRVTSAAANVFCMEGLERELAVAGFAAATSLRDVRIVPSHNLGLEHFELGVHPLEFSLYTYIRLYIAVMMVCDGGRRGGSPTATSKVEMRELDSGGEV